ncbi:hypothetical protein GCK72_006023 [Caenorhabditis remanei]|uniref:Uncharacterized protein n=1 Tax=Caenorhabditis remanei TaxID=31234 RepID=A0A6A5HH36_CAERE|nr:hypothetical protein GCK72_006023 [Caenorhabditis remanei]KAF1766067.1 hypothetical protein GCK72_006023 [Caenorhabditis remanei]
MASHHRSESESSYDFVSRDDESEELLNQKEEEKKKEEDDSSDILSFDGNVSSEHSDEFNNFEEEGSDEEENVLELENDETETSGQSEDSSIQNVQEVGERVGDPIEPSIEVPKIMENSIETIFEDNQEDKEKQEIIHQNQENEKNSDTRAEHEPEILTTDPLGAIETSILSPATSAVKDENVTAQPSIDSTVLAEINQLRNEIAEMKKTQAGQAKKITEFQKKFDIQQRAEREKELKRYSSIQTAIRGEWRLLNLEGQNETMKSDGLSFPNRVKTLVANTVYDFDGSKLTSFHRLFCKSFGHSSLKFGVDKSSGIIFSNTFMRGNMLITVWKDDRGIYHEKKERYVQDGQLYVSHINRFGERTTSVYERVKSKSDMLYSIGNAGRLYLKFW